MPPCTPITEKNTLPCPLCTPATHWNMKLLREQKAPWRPANSGSLTTSLKSRSFLTSAWKLTFRKDVGSQYALLNSLSPTVAKITNCASKQGRAITLDHIKL